MKLRFVYFDTSLFVLYVERWTRTLKAEIQQSIHLDMSVSLLRFCSHCSYLRSENEGERQPSRKKIINLRNLRPAMVADEKVPVIIFICF